MNTIQEKNQNNISNFTIKNYIDSLGLNPSYILTSSNTLASFTKLKPYYIRAEEDDTTFTAFNELTQTTLTRTLIKGGFDYYGDFSSLTVSAGSVLVYVK